jgi:lipopolysaccharide biosynthesis glycosyltransferase
MRSLYEHNPKARVFILCEDDRFPREIPFDAEVINVSGQKWFPQDGPNYHNPYSYINLLKVCYPSLLPVNKVIHLDIDTIVCESLEPMWKIDLKGKWFAAAKEDRGSYHPFGPDYYNMGIAVFNLAQLRKDKAEPMMVEYLNSFRQPWADQDAWNQPAIEQGKAVAMDVRWNENFATGQTDSPGIVHYCGIKDWYSNHFIPRRKYLDQYL